MTLNKPTPIASSLNPVYGIDVSKFQGHIDYSQVKAHDNPKIDFVYIKATEGVGYVDPNLAVNSKGFHDVGFRVGYYHFATLNKPGRSGAIIDAKQEAEAFLSAINGLPNDLPYVLDIEKNPAKLSPEEVEAYIETFMSTVEDRFPGSRKMIYSYTPFLQSNLPKTHALGSKYLLWLAQYNGRKIPYLPKGFSRFLIHQYSCEGVVNGFFGRVDMNVVYDREKLL